MPEHKMPNGKIMQGTMAKMMSYPPKKGGSASKKMARQVALARAFNSAKGGN